jgi:hypothetical protein
MMTSAFNFLDHVASMIADWPWWAMAIAAGLGAFFAYAMIVLVIQR